MPIQFKKIPGLPDLINSEGGIFEIVEGTFLTNSRGYESQTAMYLKGWIQERRRKIYARVNPKALELFFQGRITLKELFLLRTDEPFIIEPSINPAQGVGGKETIVIDENTNHELLDTLENGEKIYFQMSTGIGSENILDNPLPSVTREFSFNGLKRLPLEFQSEINNREDLSYFETPINRSLDFQNITDIGEILNSEGAFLDLKRLIYTKGKNPDNNIYIKGECQSRGIMVYAKTNYKIMKLFFQSRLTLKELFLLPTDKPYILERNSVDNHGSEFSYAFADDDFINDIINGIHQGGAYYHNFSNNSRYCHLREHEVLEALM